MAAGPLEVDPFFVQRAAAGMGVWAPSPAPADGDPVVDDLTRAQPERVVSICEALIACGACVLHGSNVRPALRRLEPRQANDAAKQSGNQRAIYASTDVYAVLMHAIVDRAYLASRFDSYTLGYRVDRGRRQYRATDNVLRLFEQRDPNLFADGFVYALDRTPFEGSPDSSSEFVSRRPAVPLRTLRVSASLASHLFGTGAPDGERIVVGYGRDELEALAAHGARLALDAT